MLLTEALESGSYMDPEQLAFLEDNGDTFTPVQASQEIPSPTAFQTDDLDVFYSDCDDVPSTKAVLMANLSSYNSDVLSERTGLFGLPIYNPISIKTTSIHSEPVFKEGNPRELLPIIVEQPRALKPLDTSIGNYSCKYNSKNPRVASMRSVPHALVQNSVRILQKSQENGQSGINTDTGIDKSEQDPGECYQDQQKSTY
ncbi:hypothetical protein Tco_0884675 [Tanacetum coccineum]